jgi:hypothetical protein
MSHFIARAASMIAALDQAEGLLVRESIAATGPGGLDEELLDHLD